MPHFTTFDRFASKAIVHPQFQEGSKAIVHPQFQEAAKAIVHPQFQPEASKAIVHPQFQPEADGFMKLGDIKGEFSPSRESLGGSSYSPWDHDIINASDFAPATKDVGWWTVDGADFRDNNHGKRSNWDVICDVGTSIKQPADVRANGAVHQDTPTDTHPNDTLLGYPSAGSEQVRLDVGPVNQTANIWTNGDASTFNADALLQQPSDVAGLISPDQMQPAEFFSHNPEWFAPGSSVDSWIEKTFGTGDGEHTFAGISQGNAFAPGNELRSDNRF